MRKKTPQLRICVTPICNLHCIYCSPEGEGYGKNLDERMTREEINQIASICADVGFTHIKFTGGEPLLRHDIVDIISDTRKITGIKKVRMVTNGVLLARYATRIKEAGLDRITISIDAANPKDYAKIRRGRLDLVMAGLQKCQEIGLPVRINSVVMKNNLDQIQPLMNLARRAKASLKLLDLVDLQRGGNNYGFWRREYYHFGELHALLDAMGGKFVGYEKTPGGVGAPPLEYHMPDSLKVVIKDSTSGTCYATSCFKCKFYPCQDALISLRITHDGHLKMCLIRNDNLLNIIAPLRIGDIGTVKQLVQDRFDILTSAKYYPHKWQPKHLEVSSSKKQPGNRILTERR